MKYSNEEKLSIVARYQQGERITALSNELAISRSTLYRWLKSFPSDSIGKPLKFSYQEYASLQRKVEKLQNIITILKSADCLVSAPLKERLHALEPFYGKYEVHTICEALDVLPLTDKIEKVLFVNGEAQQNTDSDSYTLKLGGYASVVFKLGN